uniref:Major facilitator superfamily (MFS) profile domain-containing protein n=1 Tax=Timema poppense TaxID=170557 RepID=A0A7R9DLI1_TIMPO|nr:unnamed protein product [Timema poppensis]
MPSIQVSYLCRSCSTLVSSSYTPWGPARVTTSSTSHVLPSLSSSWPLSCGMPETPHFYLATHQKSRAASSLQWLRGAHRDVTYELNALQLAVEESARNRGSFNDLVSSQASRKALLISMGLVAFQQLSGICVVLFFTQSIFHDAGSSLSPTLCTILVGLVMVLAACVGSQLVDRAGRKILLLVSGVFMFLSLFTLGLYFFFLERNYDLKRIGWLPLVSVVVYIITYVLGFGPLPWTVMAEILPANVKSVGGSIVSAFCWTLSFIVSKLFVSLVGLMGSSLVFWLFGFFCVVATLFVFCCVPETKGRSLQQIQDELVGIRKKTNPLQNDKVI